MNKIIQMFIYCIKPDGRLRCNFIKIGFSDDVCGLSKRYSTYYGLGCKYYYVEVCNKKCEYILHGYLKELGLHLENELYIHNEEYNFYYYITILEKMNISFGKESKNKIDITKYNYKSQHFIDFLIYCFNKKHVNYKIIFKNINKDNILWDEYILFCSTVSNKMFKNKIKFEEFTQIMKI